eukprot:SAG11_NODE_30397_length_301_cov_1.009901_1_plen_37_part_01
MQIITRIESRAHKLLKVPEEHGEPLQVRHCAATYRMI